MSYDFEPGFKPSFPPVKTQDFHNTDLEALVLWIEVAALLLTPTPEAEFTVEELIAEVGDLSDHQADRDDVLIVLSTSNLLQKKGKDRLCLR